MENTAKQRDQLHIVRDSDVMWQGRVFAFIPGNSVFEDESGTCLLVRVGPALEMRVTNTAIEPRLDESQDLVVQGLLTIRRMTGHPTWVASICLRLDRGEAPSFEFCVSKNPEDADGSLWSKYVPGRHLYIVPASEAEKARIAA